MIPILNVLWGIVAGEHYEYKDPKMRALLKVIVDALRTSMAEPDLTWFLPFLGKMFPNLEGDVQGYKGEPGDLKHFLEQVVQQHRDTFDGNNIRDFIDVYLVEIKVRLKVFTIRIISHPETLFQKGKEGTSFHESQGYQQLVDTLIDLFIAGMDTTSLTLTYGILFLTK